MEESPPRLVIRTIEIHGADLKVSDLLDISEGRCTAKISESARKKLEESRKAVELMIERGDTLYGVNTGFGSLVNQRIGDAELAQLQLNLVRSHACGLGEDMDPPDVLGMMLARANSLAVGVSGVRPIVVQTLLDCVKARIAPVTPRIGSLGASGDLAPLAHVALALIGEGLVDVDDEEAGWKRLSADIALSNAGIKPLILGAKEGLSLLNGTSQQIAYLAKAVRGIQRLIGAADAALACSIEGFRGSASPHDAALHLVRPHPGQAKTASRVREMLANSAIIPSHAGCDRVQDPYSFRCAPQVHGPAHEALDRLVHVTEIDLNSATDNPLIFVPKSGDLDSSRIISGGHFHGEILGQAADLMRISLAELASISERRTNVMLTQSISKLPAFLAKNPGLESGLMIAHYAAAAALAELQLDAGPASILNATTSAGQEDHVSMAATSAYRLSTALTRMSEVLAVEFVVASEALRIAEESAGDGVREVIRIVRKIVEPLAGDRPLSKDLIGLSNMLLNGDEVLDIVRKNESGD